MRTLKLNFSKKLIAASTVAVLTTAFMTNGGVASAVTPLNPITGQPSNFTVTTADLNFILQQIQIAEAHSAKGVGGSSITAGSSLNTVSSTTPLNPLSTLATDIVSPLLPYGLRQVDGRNNNLSTGYSTWNGFAYTSLTAAEGKSAAGAADQPFKRTTPQSPNQYGAGTPGTGYLAGLTVKTDGTSTLSSARLISNLISDQSTDNPAAVVASARNVAQSNVSIPAGTDSAGSVRIPNVAPNKGVAAAANGIFSLFGQFFDHGLDLVGKSGTNLVQINLDPTDPLYNAGAGVTAMYLNRTVANSAGDGVNSTTPWVDQNQTYGSHPSKQVFLREYSFASQYAAPVATGKLFTGANGDVATWAETKAQALKMGIALSDSDIGNVPLLLTDEYGNFLKGRNGFPVLVKTDGLPTPTFTFVEGNPRSPVATTGSARTGHAFVNDIACAADPSGRAAMTSPTGPDDAHNSCAPNGVYNPALLDAHYVTGDGRGNENIGLTSIHTIFHSEHDRLVDVINALLTANPALAAQWNATGGNSWGGNVRTFMAARFINEMEYQHLVFGEFVRKVEPAIKPFVAYDPSLDPSITEEFANAAYRYGHSQLNDTIDKTTAVGADASISLLAGFLTPTSFNKVNNVPVSADVAAGAIMRGMDTQVGNQIDEFVTNTLRNSLLGQPLDLPALNISRGRDAGIGTLNQAKDAYGLGAYKSWNDLRAGLKTKESIVNFMAAYGQHQTILDARDTTGATANSNSQVIAMRAAAQALFNCAIASTPAPSGALADCKDFYYSTGAWNQATVGINNIDLWIGGLAETNTGNSALGASMLGGTFDYIFQRQLENLQESDRFYYLGRTAGLNLGVQLETNLFSNLIMRNTDVVGLPGDAFAVPSATVQMSSGLSSAQAVMAGIAPFCGPVCNVISNGLNVWTFISDKFPHLNVIGTDLNDHIVTADGNDTIRAGLGDDIIESGFGDDFLFGDDGNDQLIGGDGIDILDGGFGNDYLQGGPGGGIDTLNGGFGNDFLFGNDQSGSIDLAGAGDDFAFGGAQNDSLSGDAGNDWLDGGSGADIITGDTLPPFGIDVNVPGDNVMIGGTGSDTVAGAGGDDIAIGGTGTDAYNGGFGFDWMTYSGTGSSASADLALAVPAVGNVLQGLAQTFASVEALSGGDQNDNLSGDATTDLSSLTANTSDQLTKTKADSIKNLSALLKYNTVALPSQVNPAVAAAVDGYGRTPQAGAVVNRAASAWVNGNILIGGAGSDTINGRQGNDRIDGDASLQAWLSVPGNTAGLAGKVTTVDPNDATRLVTNDIKLLQPAVLAGQLQIGDVKISRFIDLGTHTTETDTAVYNAARASYTITVLADGTVIVADIRAGGNTDGTDVLTGIERLQFTDVAVDLTAPFAPTAVSAAPINTGVQLSWAAPAFVATGTSIVKYRATVTPGGATCVVTVPAANTCNITGLTNGRAYTVVVAASSNGTSFGLASTAVAFTPQPVPSAPAAVTAANTMALSSLSSVAVSWTAATANGSPITGYIATIYNSGTTVVAGSCVAASGATTTCSVPNIPVGSYDIAVVATSAVGNGPQARTASAFTIAAPTLVDTLAPTSVTVLRVSNTSVRVNWAYTGQLYDVSYIVTATPVGGGAAITCNPGVALTCSFQTASGNALSTATSYNFVVTATTTPKSGETAPTVISNDSAPVLLASGTRGTPAGMSAPTLVDNPTMRMTVSWSAPTGSAGLIAGYTVTFQANGVPIGSYRVPNVLTYSRTLGATYVGRTITATVTPRYAAGSGIVGTVSAPSAGVTGH
jgi:Ca2+-binding RTX toxin-like protein